MEQQSYERIIQQKATGRALLPRLLLIFGYLVWLGVWLVIFLRVYLSAALVVLMLALTAALVVFTWKFVQVEYEYSIWGGSFFLAKIYGKQMRRELLEIDLKRAVLIAPRTEEFLKKANDLKPNELRWAVSSPKSENVWLLIYTDEDQSTSLLFFEADERSYRLLRRENPRATVNFNFKKENANEL